MFRVGMTWRDVIGYEGLYQVSTFGEVISLRSGRFLKGSPIPSGYLTVSLYKNSAAQTYLIHRLVALAFIDNPSAKRSVNHIDCTRTNNRADNLEWCTPAENTAHGMKYGAIKGCALKLSDEDAATIREMYESGYRSSWLADKFSVSVTTVKNIIRGKYYSHDPATAEPRQTPVPAERGGVS